MAKKILVLSLLTLLISIAANAFALEAMDITEACNPQSLGRKMGSLYDRKYTSFWTSREQRNPFIEFTAPEDTPAEYLYVCFGDMPRSWAIEEEVNGEWKKVTRRPISTDELIPVLEKITRNNSVSAVLLSGQTDYDFAYEIEETRGCRQRFRGNAMSVAEGYSTGVKITFRAIPSMPPSLKDLGV